MSRKYEYRGLSIGAAGGVANAWHVSGQDNTVFVPGAMVLEYCYSKEDALAIAQAMKESGEFSGLAIGNGTTEEKV